MTLHNVKERRILMKIAKFTRDFMRDKETLKYFNLENKLRTEGYDAGVDIGESKKTIEIAKKMLKDYSIKEISRITGLKNSEILKLKR